MFAVYLKEAADKHFCTNQTWGRSQGYSNKPKHNLSPFTSPQTTTQLSLKTVIPASSSFGHQNDQAQSSCCFDKVFTSHGGGSKQKKIRSKATGLGPFNMLWEMPEIMTLKASVSSYTVLFCCLTVQDSVPSRHWVAIAQGDKQWITTNFIECFLAAYK